PQRLGIRPRSDADEIPARRDADRILDVAVRTGESARTHCRARVVVDVDRRRRERAPGKERKDNGSNSHGLRFPAPPRAPHPEACCARPARRACATRAPLPSTHGWLLIPPNRNRSRGTGPSSTFNMRAARAIGAPEARTPRAPGSPPPRPLLAQG